MPSTTPSPQVKPSSLRLLILSPSTGPSFSPSTSASESASAPGSAPHSIPTLPLFPAFLEAITGSRPSADVTTFSGYTSHPPLRLTTKYYARDVGIWCDELPLPTARSRGAPPAQISLPPSDSNQLESDPRSKDGSQRQFSQGDNTSKGSGTGTDTNTESITPEPTLQDWTLQILSPAAREVRAVIAGIVLLLPISSTSTSAPVTSATRASGSASHELDQDHDRDPFIKLIQTAHTLREAIEDDSPGRDIASLVVLQQASAPPSSSSFCSSSATRRTTPERDGLLEQLEERCLSMGYLGWEFVAWDGREVQHNEADQGQDQEQAERNVYGEKTGLPRVLEVLQSVDWSAEPDHSDDLDDFDFDDEEDDDDDDNKTLPNIRAKASVTNSMSGFGGLDFELQREMMELKMSMLGGDDEGEEEDDDDNDSGDDPRGKNHGDDGEETQIERLPGLVERVIAIRDAGQEMGKDERERFAKREIARIMSEMG
ncbi:hypothetical protein G647_07965 [Cladophialophora carrionii CBS 160.54]|uniref:Uncharacterized protein n=1 Tax=Cladophialophora carrionii CBS 160.54 TaxID=1279043 RepID=V9D5P4_9EURO|nr:uncharacterized protein G647_07965 [Cladophialophora carrionii CBS 160.54]ETI21618.1 hypothetical protein G647_07965 [Cladophialophora carrionii CBS 160.54]